jgi:hypothetical protein
VHEVDSKSVTIHRLANLATHAQKQKIKLRSTNDAWYKSQPLSVHLTRRADLLNAKRQADAPNVNKIELASALVVLPCLVEGVCEQPTRSQNGFRTQSVQKAGKEAQTRGCRLRSSATCQTEEYFSVAHQSDQSSGFRPWLVCSGKL